MAARVYGRLLLALTALTLLEGESGAAPAAPAATASEPAWSYRVTVGAGARELSVEAWLAAGSDELTIDDGVEPFIVDVSVDGNVAQGAGGAITDGVPAARVTIDGVPGGTVDLVAGSVRRRAVTRVGDAWRIPECAARACHIHYRVHLAAAAERLDSEAAQRFGDVIEAPPSTWLLHPRRAPRAVAGVAARYRFTVATPPDIRFVSGVRALAPAVTAQTVHFGGVTYEADAALLDESSYSAFGPLTVEKIAVRGASLDVAFTPGVARLRVSRAQIVAALSRAAEAVAGYYGHFPVERALLLVMATDGDEAHGRTLGGGGATVILRVGESMTPAALQATWVLSHELFHLGFPTVDPQHLWLAEGLATYLEPLARARVGDLTDERVWGDMVDGMPQGLPAAGDRGLDHTHTWGRTYWGGALFCLVADVAIRERTGGRRSLDTALRAIVDAGGTLAARWSVARTLSVGDLAIGAPVLSELYARWRDHAVAVNLDDLWRRLGVQAPATPDAPVLFDDMAPLSSLRRALTAPGSTRDLQVH